MTINRKLRGIRDPVDPGYILGRPKNMGKGPAVQLKAPVGLITPHQTLDVLGALPASGVTAGNYTNANITVNAKGLITAAGNGSAGTLPALTDGKIWIGNGTNVAVERTLSGDVTTTNTGVTAIGAAKVLTAMIAAGNVTEAKIGLADNTTNNATTSAHGFLKKLDGNATHYMGGDGNWTTPAGNGTSGALTLITETITSGSQGNVTFSSIPNTYRTLEIIIDARGTATADTVALTLQFNSDTGSNYDTDRENQFGANYFTGQTGITIAEIPAANVAANYTSGVYVMIPNYKGTTFYKRVWARSDLVIPGIGLVESEVGWWLNTAAITSIKIFPSSGNIVDGSLFSLYGRM